jgi:hypothetical protein
MSSLLHVRTKHLTMKRRSDMYWRESERNLISRHLTAFKSLSVSSSLSLSLPYQHLGIEAGFPKFPRADQKKVTKWSGGREFQSRRFSSGHQSVQFPSLYLLSIHTHSPRRAGKPGKQRLNSLYPSQIGLLNKT